MNNPGSLKELIPEFYEDETDFLLNLLNVDFGFTSKDEKVNVKLEILIKIKIRYSPD